METKKSTIDNEVEDHDKRFVRSMREVLSSGRYWFEASGRNL